MTTVRLHRSSGTLITLGRQIAAGGEGRIYEIENEPTLLAKLYIQSVDDKLREKLIAMCQVAIDLSGVAAWPIDLISDPHGHTVGFVMPRVEATGDIDQLSHPAARRQAFPAIDYGFLIHVSMNLMRAAQVIHSANCVVGDVNQSNVRVRADGTVCFIDADSFQIGVAGKIYPCRVGTQMYTPPELQGRNFAKSIRTPAHDAFGLAVLVFQLLMFGRHPFAGVPQDRQQRTIEQAIADRAFAYSPKAAGLSPPPGALPLSALGDLSSMFERAFLTTARPSATDWMSTLDRLRPRLLVCAQNPRHRKLSEGPCPLCELPRDPLPDHGTRPLPDTSSLSVAQLIQEATQLPELGTVEHRCSISQLSPSELRLPTIPEEGTCQQIAKIVFVISGIALCVFPPATLIGIVLGGILHLAGKAQDSHRHEAFLKQKLVLAHALDQLTGLESRVRSLETTANIPLGKIAKERRTLELSASQLQNALEAADRTYHDHLLNTHLEKYLIANAAISGIAESRTATLTSFGIETAADVTRHHILRIPGFGPELTARLLRWRNRCVGTFPDDAPTNAPTTWLDAIRQDHAQQAGMAANRLRLAIDDYRNTFEMNSRRFDEAARQLDAARSAVLAARK